MIARALPKLDPGLVWREPAPADAALRLRFLGTAGFVLEAAARTIAVDPFVSRPSLAATLLAPLRPDPALVRRHVPRADDVLVGHAHHDHVLDAPEVCSQTGARFVGSPDACNVARAAGLPEASLVETRGREEVACGAVRVRGIPSRHGRAIFRRVPLPGSIPRPPPWPPRVTDLRHGLVLDWLVEAAGRRVVHIDSADFIDAELAGVRADVVLLCAVGRRWRARYVEDAVRLLRPRFVVACHWDWFFAPIDDEPRLLPGVDLHGFCREARDAGATPVVLPFFGTLAL